ncbi:hypothetical protein I302_104289 [Kwoniella bestiolae CBS 10118]|uniref:Uncharacterized protein n=1 Tax=Kwoniella bestiolae CBS 10118 TaxID=1296100 RepID=A0A1B9GAV6_9TREE|nr:hypothetical protein I302_02996 [Kwoniella bestiolae CBS 10118]OCF28145.1 hypothetical protein I302_02996 [Kwoniella bestiolae CBS 10118]
MVSAEDKDEVKLKISAAPGTEYFDEHGELRGGPDHSRIFTWHKDSIGKPDNEKVVNAYIWKDQAENVYEYFLVCEAKPLEYVLGVQTEYTFSKPSEKGEIVKDIKHPEIVSMDYFYEGEIKLNSTEYINKAT